MFFSVERDSLRERERHARAQMSSQGSEIQEGVPMFKPPVKVSPGATDRVTQQIQSRLGDYHSVKHLLDDPKSSIGVYGEPASPAPGGPLRGGEFKKPQHASSQNGRPHQRMPHYPKGPEGMPLGVPKRAPPARLYNGRSFQNTTPDLDVQVIINEIKCTSVPLTPLSAIAATPRKEMESKFTFPGNLIKPIENISQSNNFCDVKQNIQNKTYLDRHSNRRSSVELEKDLRLTDSEDETGKRRHSVMVSSPAGASSSDSGSTDSETDSSSDDSKPNGPVVPEISPGPDVEETPEVVEGPGETTAVPPLHRSSWSLRNFAPPQMGAPAPVQLSSPRSNSHSSPVRNSKNSPRSNRSSPVRNMKSSPRFSNRLSPRINRSSPRCPKSPRSNRIGDVKINNISSTAPGSNTSTSSNNSGNHNESDSCSDSKEIDSKEVEKVLADAKRKAGDPLSDLPDSDGSESDSVRQSIHSDILGSSFDRSGGINRSVNRTVARRSPRTPARPRPPSSPSASEDEAPRPQRPDPEKRKGRGRPRKLRTDEDAGKRRRGRPPKAKSTPIVRLPPSSSDEESSHSSPPIPTHSDSDPESSTVASTVDKKKNDTIRKLFLLQKVGKGGGKGGAKGGKGKGQVMIIEANSLEHDEDVDFMQRRTNEEEQRRLKEEEASLRKMKEIEALRRKQEEEYRKKQEEIKRNHEDDMLRKRNEEILQRKLKEEAHQKRHKEEEARRKLDEEKRREEERRKDEEERRRLKEEDLQRRRKEESEEAIQRRLLEQKRLKNEEMSHRKMKEDETLHRRYPDDIVLQRKIKENELSSRAMKDEDALQRRIREDEANQRRLKADDSVEDVPGRPQLLVQIDLWKLSADCTDRLDRLEHSRKRPPPPPPAPPDKRIKIPRLNPEVTPTNHERVENGDLSRHCMTQPLVYYSYLEKGYQDCSSDDESRDHKFYLSEAIRLRKQAENEMDPLNRIMLYQESVLCFVLTGRVLELELDTKKAFTMYRETLEYIKTLNSTPARRASPFSTTYLKLDILSYRCQALLCLRMFKMYKREVKEYNKILQDYQRPVSIDNISSVVGTVSPLSPTPSPAGSIGSIGSAGSSSSGYGSGSSGAPAATPHHTPGPTPTSAATNITIPVHIHNASLLLVKYYTFLHMGHDLWDQADALIRDNHWTDLFVSVDRVCGPLTMHSTFRHLVKYVRYALSILKSQGRHST